MWFSWFFKSEVRMADESASEEKGGGGGAATIEPPPAKPAGKTKTKSAGKTKPKPPQRRNLPPWKVLLHNDNKNTFEHVILSILELTPLKELQAIKVTEEAHRGGVALLLVTHRERAELFVDQFQTKTLKVTIEPAE